MRVRIQVIVESEADTPPIVPEVGSVGASRVQTGPGYELGSLELDALARPESKR